MTRINIEIPDELHKNAKLQAVMDGVTLIQFINEALEEQIKEDEKKGK